MTTQWKETKRYPLYDGIEVIRYECGEATYLRRSDSKLRELPSPAEVLAEMQRNPEPSATHICPCQNPS